jgi:hypothetical protein
MHARRWEHRIEDGAARAVIDLADGRCVDTTQVQATLNRLSAPRVELLPPGPPQERDYAAQELWALWTSVFHALPGPVLNRASPEGLSGPWPSEASWTAHAARAGLRTNSWPDGASGWGETRQIILVDGAVVGRHRAPLDVMRGCRALAAAVQCGLLGIWFAPGWRFVGATSRPDLREGGDALADVLAGVLGGAE